MTPLIHAAKWGNFEIVKLLIEKNANVNSRDIKGNTVLSTARANNHESIYNYLLENGAVELANNNQPIQNTGISSLLDNNESIDFQKGKYRLFSGGMEITFLGNSNSGNINYTRNGILNTGFYRIEGNNLSIIIEGRTFAYTIDSNMSFSGNNEIWVRIGN
jgi:ankyrin repeat protein